MRTIASPISLDRELTFGQHTFGYFVRSGAQAWSELSERLAELHADHFVIVTDSAFPGDVAEWVREHIATVGDSTLLTFPASESAKNIATIEDLSVRAEEEAGITISSCIIALGGGLVANVAGYWAASQFRGLKLVHLPTTLLSMADVMPSLKQGVNTRRGKNHLGAFYAPCFVWNDLAFLETLPGVEVTSALCEMVKFILSIKPESFDLYHAVISSLRPEGDYREAEFLRFIQLCVDAKCKIMRDDPFEQKEGLVFEYGHTIGHPLELLSYQEGRRPLPHGLAVGLGMLVAARISCMMGDMLTPEDEATHLDLLRRLGAPLVIPADVPTRDILDLLPHDNKRGRLLPTPPGMVNMVLLKRLREPNRTRGTVLTQVPEEMIREAIEACRTERR